MAFTEDKADDSAVTNEIKVFVRQLLQLVNRPDLRWPDSELLKELHNQQYIWKKCFWQDQSSALPPVRYRYSVLKLLVRKLEDAIMDPEEDEISDDLMDALSELMGEELPSEVDAAQQRSWVTYEFTNPQTTSRDRIRMLESRSILSGSGTTGFRTWEAALHLGNYLLSSTNGTKWVEGKTVLELGAGTGFLSILSRQSLQAHKVVCTDGSGEMVDIANGNIALAPNITNIETGTLKWGWALKDSVLEEYINHGKIDTVIGADVTYDTSVIPALVSTIRHLFEIWPALDVLISATIRNVATFDAFRTACESNGFLCTDIDFPVVPADEQQQLFYSAAVPIRIVHIRSGLAVRSPFELP